jgi:hypothetical protein
MEQVVPWQAFLALIEPCCPKATNIIVLKRSPVLPEKETFLPNSIFLLIFFTLI